MRVGNIIVHSERLKNNIIYVTLSNIAYISPLHALGKTNKSVG